MKANHKTLTKLKKYSGRKPGKKSTRYFYLGVVNHCKEPDGNIHWHFFWDFDNIDLVDLRFYCQDFQERFQRDLMLIRSSPIDDNRSNIHVICPEVLNLDQVKEMERWALDHPESDYFPTEDAKWQIRGATGATLRLSDKNGHFPKAIIGFGMHSREARICTGILSLYGGFERQGHWAVREEVMARPSLIVYSGAKKKRG